MGYILSSVSRYTMIAMIIIYTFDAFAVLWNSDDELRGLRIYRRQTLLIYLLLVNGALVVFVNSMDIRVPIMALAQGLIIAAAMAIYKKVYEGASYALVNHMSLLLVVGFIMLSRLDMDKAMRQLVFTAAALVVTCFVPLMIEKLRVWKSLKWLYAAAGIGLLGIVTVLGNRTFGANLSITIAGVTLQPSELVKIIFVFYVSCMLYQLPQEDRHMFSINFHAWDFRVVVITTVVAAAHVLVLVAARDLGSASIYFLTYLAMLYVATRKPTYFFAGLGFFGIASVAGYFLFGHVRARVEAWRDPIAAFDTTGNQVSHSLFAMASGGWFGSGLCQGMPLKIPVVTKDFIFAAISEEMGGIFALCVILICIAYFLAFMRISLRIRDQFYKLIALGLGVTYGIQVILMIGGVIKFIPSTGVTLPFVSYGGSSLLSTMFMIAIIQGLYCRQSDVETLQGDVI